MSDSLEKARREVEARFREVIGPIVQPLPVDHPATLNLVSALQKAVDICLEREAAARLAWRLEQAEHAFNKTLRPHEGPALREWLQDERDRLRRETDGKEQLGASGYLKVIPEVSDEREE